MKLSEGRNRSTNPRDQIANLRLHHGKVFKLSVRASDFNTLLIIASRRRFVTFPSLFFSPRPSCKIRLRMRAPTGYGEKVIRMAVRVGCLTGDVKKASFFCEQKREFILFEAISK